MKSFRRNQFMRSRGFTLIELLTVIVIIGVLAGMISTAVMLAKKKSIQVARTAELTAIKSAIDSYRYEYQEWPCPEGQSMSPPASKTYKNDNRIVIHDWLMNSSEGRNDRNVRFLNLGDYKQDASGNLVDYSGTPYEIIFDFSNDKVSVN